MLVANPGHRYFWLNHIGSPPHWDDPLKEGDASLTLSGIREGHGSGAAGGKRCTPGVRGL